MTMSQHDRPMGSRSRSVPPAARLAGGSAPTPAAPTPNPTPTPTQPRQVDISKWATKALADFVEAKNNMGHNNSHPDITAKTPVGLGAPRGSGSSSVVQTNRRTGSSSKSDKGTPQGATTGYRVNLGSSAGAREATGAANTDTVVRAPQPIRSLKKRAPSSYGPQSSPFATDLTSATQT